MATKHKVKTQAGLDIGSFSVKAVELIESTNGKFELSNYAVEKINVDNPAESVKKAVTSVGISMKQPVSISVSGPSVVVRYVDFPKMTKEELKKAIRFEAEKHIPYKIDDVIIDCDILEDISENKMRVLLVAAKKDLINNRLKIAQDSGFSINCIDIDSFALLNAFLLTDAGDPDLSVALVNIGAKTTNVNIIKNKTSYFIRDIQIGGDDFTKKLSEKLNIQIDEAEMLKCNMGQRQDEVYQSIAGVLDNLTDELRLSFDYYESRYAKAVNKIFLSGGAASMERFDKFLTEALGIEIAKWDATKSLNISSNISQDKLDKDAFQLGVGIGLAIRKD